MGPFPHIGAITPQMSKPPLSKNREIPGTPPGPALAEPANGPRVRPVSGEFKMWEFDDGKGVPFDTRKVGRSPLPRAIAGGETKLDSTASDEAVMRELQAGNLHLRYAQLPRSLLLAQVLVIPQLDEPFLEHPHPAFNT